MSSDQGWPGPPGQPVADDRIWIDGCFDFSHHGHAGAMLQARQFGRELLVGVHSDEEILKNKGPVVMTLEERVMAVEACRWCTSAVPLAPYVTEIPWIDHYGCRYVVHGDDITSDADGNDCYRDVKAAGRFKVVKRTPGISTTDLVGRMLLCTKDHFIRDLRKLLIGKPGGMMCENEKDRDTEAGSSRWMEWQARGTELQKRIVDYATNSSGLKPSGEVWRWNETSIDHIAKENEDLKETNGDSARTMEFVHMVGGRKPLPGQRIIYIDGGFDLFNSGHIAFLQEVVKAEEEIARVGGWYDKGKDDERRKILRARTETSGEEFPYLEENYTPYFIVAGIYDDITVNRVKGLNYPIMNMVERGLCVLQCKYVDALIFSAPYGADAKYLQTLPPCRYLGEQEALAAPSLPAAVYHGPTRFNKVPEAHSEARRLGIYREIGPHRFDDVSARTIVTRILKSRGEYERRQQIKAEKAAKEEKARDREKQMQLHL